MKNFLIALQFLTAFPVKVKAEIQEKEIGASLLYFPLVGLVIGIALSLCAIITSPLPVLLKSAVILIISVIITGGIHLDGFADTCDGFYGNRPKERILQIMRDSHIGAMGAIGVTMILLVKFSALASIAQKDLWKPLILTPVFSRWFQVVACNAGCYARQDGKAKYFMQYARKKDIFIGGLFTLGLFLLLMRIEGLILFFISMLSAFLFLNYIRKKIGGMTGDTIGAVSEFSEAVTLLFCVLVWNR